jgi:hypothetical protein
MAAILRAAPRPSLPAAALVGTCLTVVVVLAELPTPLRAPLVLLWAFVVPGWAWARRTRLRDRGDVLLVSVALSAILIVLIAGTMALLGAWSPGWAFALLVMLTLAGLVLPRRHPGSAEGAS